MADYMNEVATRSAPRWAWDFIDALLDEDVVIDNDTPRKMRLALGAMVLACAEPELDVITQADVVEAEADGAI